MKLCVLTVPLYDRPLEEALKFLSGLGVHTIELGAGGNPGTTHLDPAVMLKQPDKLDEFKELLKKYDTEISALSTHTNHVHPDKRIREQAHEDFINACRLAEKLKLNTVITFSGCPGDHDAAKYPNWVTCSWPTDYQKILAYQWEEQLIPYWKRALKEAAEYGVTKVAIELHPGFCVYNTQTMLRLRDAAGDNIGANLDPSHLFWQGIEPVEAIKVLKGIIFHFHAKDTHIDKANTRVNGVLDTTTMDRPSDRSWLFRGVGFGHGSIEWREIITALRLVGYDGAISIEHEDAFMSRDEGLAKAVSLLQNIVMEEKPSVPWWTN
jgi:sugar phosphate isomerase/epimerase